ncbi:hypothetical protein E4665_06760 [Sporolactobacillus shoreae]|uniref:BstEII n=1 Tax=Sporolactobacillus shoreae TaxID=1465501 RepID=A0A4Z0GPB7_9BACL|nr:hypothetical protein [Sporolactobacillus shoreae]TGA99013.1 hypothetical protein E4665_06760 [Sporolactobacillus shoreae]
MEEFSDYRSKATSYITFIDSEYYPDSLHEAVSLYTPVLEKFYDLVFSSTNSQELLRSIQATKQEERIQLLRLFRKYISPDTSVEMLKKKKDTETIIEAFSSRFRRIEEVRSKIYKKESPDPTIATLLYEYKDRGKKGYELTEYFFKWFEETFESEYTINGPRRAGKDLILSKELDDFTESVPADFIIYRKSDNTPLVIGFARYDSDRGGAQEDDRTSGNRDKITIISKYALIKHIPLKVLFINDGPGLLLGSMWRDYSDLEDYGHGRAMVCTLKMLPEKLTKDWIES